MQTKATAFLLAARMVRVAGHTHSRRYFPCHVHIEHGVAAEFALITGLIICLYGFRLLRAMIFVCGFLIAGLVVSATFEQLFGLQSWVLIVSWIGGFVMGIAGGCVALAFFPFGVFLVGLVLTYAFILSLPYRMIPTESNAVLNGAVVLVGGLLAWLLVCPFAIVATSFMGSVAAVWGIGYFAGKYPSDHDIARFHSHMADGDTWVYAVPRSWWAYLAAMLLLFVLGVVKQTRDVDKKRRSSHIGHYTGRRFQFP